MKSDDGKQRRRRSKRTVMSKLPVIVCVCVCVCTCNFLEVPPALQAVLHTSFSIFAPSYEELVYIASVLLSAMPADLLCT